MLEFNDDGTLKLPDTVQAAKKQTEEKLKTQRCIKIRREVVSYKSPKKCHLHITLSEKIDDPRFIFTIYKAFKEWAEVNTKLLATDRRHFKVEIDTDFRRCTDCNSLVYRYREFLEGNLIEDRGTCTFEKRDNFAYEDYFD